MGEASPAEGSGLAGAVVGRQQACDATPMASGPPTAVRATGPKEVLVASIDLMVVRFSDVFRALPKSVKDQLYGHRKIRVAINS